jgi:hypothetical protein
MNPRPIAEWTTYLAVQAGAAATLTGLVFVAVSLNLKKVVTFPGLSSRAGESLLQLLDVFFISSFALIPGQPAKLLGIEVFAIALFSWTAQVTGQIHYIFNRSGHPLTWLTFRALGAQLATLPFCVAGVEIFGGSPHALYWLAFGFTFSVISALFTAWVLLIEILR